MTTDRALQASPDAHLTTGQILAGLNTVRSVLAADLSDDELRLFAMVANRSGLDPFAKQIYAVKRGKKVTFQTGIDGYRSIAARTGLYDGQDRAEYGPACECSEAPKPHPLYCIVNVYRKGVSRPFVGEAYWHEYKPSDYDAMWREKPHVMLSKVAEAIGLRKAFPYDPENRVGIGADLYTDDEMARADRPVAPVQRVTLAEVARAKAAEAVQEGAGPREVMAVVNDVMDATQCGVQAQDGLMLGAVCILGWAHAGAHKSADGSWPRG